MKLRTIKAITAASMLALGLGFAAAPANAALITASLVGGVPTGVNYVNFDNLPLGAAGGTSGGVAVSFVPDGQTVTGAASGLYAAPFISNHNGALFGDPTLAGADTTKYLTTGVGSIVLGMPAAETYLGLLWGSVDMFNTLQFFMNTTLVGTLTGADITALADGDQGVNGTYYVNILSSLPFNKVIASSTSYAFELDNVAYNPTNPNNPVPEPFSLGLLGLGVFGAAFLRRRKAAAV
jgi:hypothetical protein